LCRRKQHDVELVIPSDGYATLLWLRVYRQNQPELFRMAP
jgi:hypothetical protein